MVNKCKCGIALLVTAAVVLAGGLAISFVLPEIVRKDVRKAVIMTPGSAGFKSWVDDTQPGSSPRYYNMYFYNITNPAGVLRGEKPRLQEVGPFHYRQYAKNLNYSWSEGNNVLTFFPWQFFKSLNYDGTNITTLNIPFKGILAALPYILDGLLDAQAIADLYDLAHYDAEHVLFSTVPAHGLSFGYEDPFLQALTKGAFSYPGLAGNSTAAEALAIPSSSMLTGLNDTSLVRQQVTWKGQTEVTCCASGVPPNGTHCTLGWDSPLANALKGTEGRQFAPGVQAGSSEWVFVDVIFRSARIQNRPGPNQHVKYKGIDLLRFTIPPSVLENATQNPVNAGYDDFGPYGLINVTRCAKGIKTFLSKPHFLDADPSLRDNVVFLDEPPGPVTSHRNLWDTFLDVEPVTGKTVRAAERLQINMPIGPMPNFRLNFTSPRPGFADVREALVPVGWLEKLAEADDAQAKELYDDITVPGLIAFWSRWGAVAAAGVLVLTALLLFWRHYQPKDEEGAPYYYHKDGEGVGGDKHGGSFDTEAERERAALLRQSPAPSRGGGDRDVASQYGSYSSRQRPFAHTLHSSAASSLSGHGRNVAPAGMRGRGATEEELANPLLRDAGGLGAPGDL